MKTEQLIPLGSPAAATDTVHETIVSLTSHDTTEAEALPGCRRRSVPLMSTKPRFRLTRCLDAAFMLMKHV